MLAPALAAAAPLRAPKPGEPAEAWWRTVARPEPLSPLAWLQVDLEQRADYRIGAESALALLRRFKNPKVERPGEWRTFWTGRYGFDTWWRREPLVWSQQEPGATREPAAPLDWVESLRPPQSFDPPEVAGVDVVPTWVFDTNARPQLRFEHGAPAGCAAWQQSIPVTLARYGGEHETFRLLECDGSVAADALDRVSVLARPPGVPRPALPLPLEPDSEAAANGEWVSGVRLLDPRLVWVLAVLAESFPHRTIYVISGYRADAGASFHKKGRALDLFVMGVPNENVLRVCRKLKDVGCGYYPNNSFVHVDVRPPATGHALWIDVSGRGEPSRYVDSWPGVVSGGALAWAGAEQ